MPHYAPLGPRRNAHGVPAAEAPHVAPLGPSPADASVTLCPPACASCGACPVRQPHHCAAERDAWTRLGGRDPAVIRRSIKYRPA